jgi:anthranilate synthase component 1
LEKLRRPPPDDRRLPEMFFMLSDTVLVFDHFRHTIMIVVNVAARGRGRVSAAVAQARERIARVVSSLGCPLPASESAPLAVGKPRLPAYATNMSRNEFLRKVRRAKHFIGIGDIIQVVLSQRFSCPYGGDPFDLYRALRMLNPSPYMFFLECGESTLVGSSPEMLVRLEGDELETRPIAGTRPRGATPDADLELERALLADPKEKAEHVMLVDLGRNDLGRVCRYGTVRVADRMIVERYSHVMHLVSGVKGTLGPGKDAFDALRACFPAGTVSGAPKVRAMEIIDELEPVRRGPYAGAVGYISFSGNMDTAIAIRTIVVVRGTAYVQAGMGIVADSVPEREYEESLDKARAGLLAVSVAGGVK